MTAAALLLTGTMFIPKSLGILSTPLMVCLTALLITQLNDQHRIYSLLRQKWLVSIGILSYSLYLWHWGVLTISHWTIGVDLVTAPFQVIAIFALAFISYGFIEKPMRLGVWFNNRSHNLAIGYSALMVSAISLELLNQTNLKTKLLDLGTRLLPPSFSFDIVAQDELYCDLPKNINSAISDCLKGGRSTLKPSRILLLGDSHASNHYWSIQRALDTIKARYTLGVIVENGFINLFLGNNSCEGYTTCLQNAKDRYQEFFRQHLQSHDIVLLSLARDKYTTGDFQGTPREGQGRLKV